MLYASILFFFVCLGLPVVGSVAYAFEVVISGAEVALSWTEPVNNVMNSEGIVVELTDLDSTWATWTVLNGNGERMPCGDPVPASSPSGGGSVSATCMIPAQDNAETKILFQAWARDTMKEGHAFFNPSEAIEVNLTLDLLKPQPPS